MRQATISNGKEVWAVTADNTVFVHNGDWHSIEGQTGTHVSVSSAVAMLRWWVKMATYTIVLGTMVLGRP